MDLDLLSQVINNFNVSILYTQLFHKSTYILFIIFVDGIDKTCKAAREDAN